MDIIEEAIRKVNETGKDVFIPCQTKQMQESVRTMAFFKRRHIGLRAEEAAEIGVTKVEKEDQRFIRIYKKENELSLLVEDENGELVPMKRLTTEQQRILVCMAQDGCKEEEIEEMKTNFLKEKGGS